MAEGAGILGGGLVGLLIALLAYLRAREAGAARVVGPLLKRLEAVEARSAQAEQRAAGAEKRVEECEKRHEDAAKKYEQQRQDDRKACDREIAERVDGARAEWARDLVAVGRRLRTVLADRSDTTGVHEIDVVLARATPRATPTELSAARPGPPPLPRRRTLDDELEDIARADEET